MELYSWNIIGDMHPKPSVFTLDIDALVIKSICVINKVELSTVTSYLPPFKISANSPVLKTEDNKYISGFSAIMSYLRRRSSVCGMNDFLDDHGLATMQAYTSFCSNQLFPAIRYLLWCNDANYNATTRRLCASSLGLPFSLFIPDFLRSRYVKAVHASCQYGDNEPTTLESKIVSNGRKCLNYLDKELGEADFYGGNTTCSLDAYVYSAISLIIELNLPNNPLRDHVATLPGLSAYRDRVAGKYPELVTRAPIESPVTRELKFSWTERVLTVGAGLSIFAWYLRYVLPVVLSTYTPRNTGVVEDGELTDDT